MQFKTNPKSLEQKNYAVASPLTLRRTKGLFFALCFYLLSQSFTIPLLPIGTWAIWPNLSDFAVGLLVLMFLLNFRCVSPASHANKRIFLILVLVLYGSILSYTSYLAWVDKDASGIKFGIFQIYRLVEFISIFWITAHIPLTPERINILRRIIDFVLVFVCLGIILTFFSILPLATLTAHLPQSPDVAGPWSRYIPERFGDGWGTIGYNHAYGGIQVLMIVSLRIHLTFAQKEISDNIFLFLSILASFLTGSRAGLAGMLAFATIYWFKKPTYAVMILVTSVLGSIPAIMFGQMMISLFNQENYNPDEDSIFDRQKTLLNANNSENLSGRDEIWQERIDFLDEDPSRWFLGTGFGSAVDSGDNAHMLFLHIILETGIVGLLCFGILFAQILIFLYRCESGIKSIFWVTVTFLLTSLTQENFYPVPALGHFIGFYLCSVAIALRGRSQANCS
jgi:hypothetical protein